ncbi:MAG: hypothetical protein U5R31_15115 [Acidimicrobiia bacterium]|nr:hypothetical protein [Acidimicrobiia bacterium]
MSGRLTDDRPTELVLVAVDGTVVAASPVWEADGLDGYFSAMLPSDLLNRTEDLRLGIVRGDEVLEVANLEAP